MKIVTCLLNQKEELGFILDDKIYICSTIRPGLPHSMLKYLMGGDKSEKLLQSVIHEIITEEINYPFILVNEATLLAPIPHPTSLRDGYAFRQHVETSRRNRGLDMIPEFDQFPVFYFSNHQNIQGPGEVFCMPLHLDQLDFELEVAIVINKTGINIPAAEADQYIGGFMIMNDFSARKMQMQEMKLNLGPAKGKDFATALGPWLVTKDELQQYKLPPPEGHQGEVYKLAMTCHVNGIQVSAGNLESMHWTFAELIERASYGVQLYPGDVIGSGTVGTGCFLELNGSNMLNNPSYQEQWLQVDDKIELQVTGLGLLRNTIMQRNTI